MSSWLLRGARIVDPVSSRDETAEVMVRDGLVAEVGTSLDPGDAEVMDLGGCVIAPGLVDMHTHLREPGREDEETVLTASRAAAAGGYTAVCAMPNTDPVADNAAIVEQVWASGRDAGIVDVIPSGALSKNLAGKDMADIGEMMRSAAEVRLFTDDGHGLQNASLVRRTMEYISGFDGIYAEHCEDAPLAAGGQMNEGVRSAELGLQGIPAEAEELMAARDVVLARLTGCRLHLLHVSTAGTVEIVRRAKAEGIDVTAEVTPHHLCLTDEAVTSYDPHAKVNPPLRTEADRLAVIEGIVDGTIDAIATDHAPHALEEKDQEYVHAPPGMLGLETALGLVLTELVETGRLGLGELIARMSANPARILGLEDHGSISEGRPANLVVFDPTARWRVDPDAFNSKSRNTPFGGRELTGRVVHTFFRGRLTVRDGAVLEGALS